MLKKFKFLYHGSNKLIKGDKIIPNIPDDTSSKENSSYAVYATDRKDIALGMALTGDKYTKSFGDYSKKPYQSIFVRSYPKSKYVYVYTVSSKNFEEKPKRSHQWLNNKFVKILKREKYKVSELDKYWRKATDKEKKYYYKIKNVKKV